MINQQVIEVATPGRGFTNMTDRVMQVVAQSGCHTGLCHVFLHHTSASLIINENADPTVLEDFEKFMGELVIDGDLGFKHMIEGPDDMPSHIRTILTNTFLVIPITQNRLALGQWQGIFLWEHRVQPRDRKITITIQGISN
jgi:secondary thiamine-phosphate synthase enzyme